MADYRRGGVGGRIRAVHAAAAHRRGACGADRRAPAGITDKLARGEYLARAADCVACHTAPGGTPYAGGFAFKLPFGTIYGTNITADKETGIGNWSDDQFVRAVREGIGPQGNLYPAMPYTSYTELSRDDVLAIKDYLFSLPPVKQANPQNDLSFPFNQRWGMKFWNLAFFHEQRFAPDLNKDEQWNRGAYLATAWATAASATRRAIWGSASTRAST